MILYGMKIDSDIEFSLSLPSDSEYKETITLSQNIPQTLKESLTCGTYLHTTHEHKVYLYSNQEISKTLQNNQPFCYEADGLVRFYWYHNDKTIYYEILDASIDVFSFWFVHPFFSLFLSIEEYFVLLHGSAVEINGKSILFLAPYKSGKSTLTNYIVKQGHKLITDDILPTFIKNNQIYYAPSHPYSRPFRETKTLGILEDNYKITFDTIDTIYLLQNYDNTTKTTITPIKGLEKFKLTRKNSLIYTLPHIRIKHEKYLGILLNSIDFFVIKRPWGEKYLHDTYKAIKKHLSI